MTSLMIYFNTCCWDFLGPRKFFIKSMIVRKKFVSAILRDIGPKIWLEPPNLSKHDFWIEKLNKQFAENFNQRFATNALFQFFHYKSNYFRNMRGSLAKLTMWLSIFFTRVRVDIWTGSRSARTSSRRCGSANIHPILLIRPDLKVGLQLRPFSFVGTTVRQRRIRVRPPDRTVKGTDVAH